MRDDVRRLVALGHVPREGDSEDYWEEFEARLHSVTRPITEDEAEALLTLFNVEEEEDGRGLAWTLIHLIESSGMMMREPGPKDGAWQNLLRERVERTKGR